ncbi:ATP-binding protein [Thermobrachium celere]|uniref:DNA replication protein DnaC n=1 Tax=Thermobrachium celere DSM 8682 TaxID=941824 RepID=R7RU91_9CLOT|nr:ATP-binding protein [Thermobrachium celere]CDF59001.1 DNA replication protein DnaC [Thermobrachium celere DSM 8682]
MKNKYISEILNEYEKLRENAKLEQSKRIEEIYEKIPRIKDIDKEISQIGFRIATSVVSKDIDNIEEYINTQKEKITDLKIEKTELLSRYGYPIDYMEIKYKCKKCKDTGYINNKYCSCFRQKLINKYYQQSNLNEILRTENFDTFNFEYYSSRPYENEELSPRDNIERIYAYAVNYTKNFDKINESLFFYGSSGLGKTFLSNCIAKELLDKGKVVIYQTAANLMDIIRRCRFEENSNYNELNELLECDFLIIDDLGTEPVTPYSYSELFNIINTRILNKKKMLISTNFQLNDIIQNYPERITSRILGHFTLFKFYGEDIRIQKKFKK